MFPGNRQSIYKIIIQTDESEGENHQVGQQA